VRELSHRREHRHPGRYRAVELTTGVIVIDLQAAGAVRVLTLSSGAVNALDVELLQDLAGALRGLRDSGAPALVVTGAGRVFSAGVDLNRVVDGPAGYTDRLVPAISAAIEALFGYPGPTVAAINGAAIAGGCVLACACDRRLMSPQARIGASEVRVGVPFPVAALEIMRYACGDHAEDVLLGGRVYQGAEATANGLVHRVVTDDLLGAAVAEAADLGGIPVDAYRHTKAQLRAPALARMREGDSVDAEGRRLWAADETRRGIAAFLEGLRRRDG
jgi:enoyl-CoA hydratase